MTDVAAATGSADDGVKHVSETSLSTQPDPRTSSSSDLSRAGSVSPHHPDLNNEVAALSNKLISAINHQTTLEDTVAATRHELEDSKARIQKLEAEKQEHKDQLAGGLLLKKVDVDNETAKLLETLAEERSQKRQVEKDKKGIEQELENLTAALFEEANEMVAAAQKEREAAERKNDQLKAQIKDTENLLASHQEQLTELKLVMQQMTSEPDEIDSHTNASTTPSSPGVQREDSLNKLLEAMNLSPRTPGAADISPAPSTSFTHLLKPVCRTDLQAYDDFHNLLQVSQTSKPASRVTSGSYGGLNVMGLSSLTHHGQSHPLGNSATNGSSSSLSTPTTHNSSPATPASTNGSLSSRDPPASYIPLKETRFYKRALTEDIEPTLRLDSAPGISWLTRRAVLNTICEGSLVVEPMPQSSKRLYVFACSLCGEHRKGDVNARTHRFRTSDSETAQRYPLCVLCLEKVRSTCDFVGFLRMIKDGHMRIGDADEEKDAWEQTVKLRERMFWARVGGGVVPAFVQFNHSTQNTPGVGDTGRKSQDSTNRVIDAEEGAAKGKDDDVFQSNKKQSSNDEKGTLNGSSQSADESTDSPGTDDEAGHQLKTGLQNHVNNTDSALPSEVPVTPAKRFSAEAGLKVTIPGSFDF